GAAAKRSASDRNAAGRARPVRTESGLAGMVPFGQLKCGGHNNNYLSEKSQDRFVMFENKCGEIRIAVRRKLGRLGDFETGRPLPMGRSDGLRKNVDIPSDWHPSSIPGGP